MKKITGILTIAAFAAIFTTACSSKDRADYDYPDNQVIDEDRNNEGGLDQGGPGTHSNSDTNTGTNPGKNDTTMTY
jgi:hypothetical protein